MQCPFFHKPKDLGWWLVLGAPDGELLALKRVTVAGTKQRSELSFAAPLQVGDVTLSLWLVADAIRGLDKQIQVPLTVE